MKSFKNTKQTRGQLTLHTHTHTWQLGICTTHAFIDNEDAKNRGAVFADLPDVGIPESQGEMQPISQVSSMESDATMYHDDTPPMSNLSSDAEDSQQSVFSQEAQGAEVRAPPHEENMFSDDSMGDCSRQGPQHD